jgi:NADPH:quinone reductase-like Zn-dependent oxidoreductase
MRAAVLHEYGSTPVVERDWDEPAADGGLLVDVVVAGVNPVDLRIGTGSFYGGVPPVPYVIGREGIARMNDGSLVYFDSGGAWGERTRVDPDAVVPIPEGVDPGVAVGLGIAGLAAWLSLEWRAELREGETVLVLGASGAVGRIAVQGAKLLGAGRVVAAARSEDGLRRAVELGADATVRLGSDDDAGALREAVGDDGADVVIDPLWGAPVEAAVTAAGAMARVVQLGESAGSTATFPASVVRGKPLAILGHTNFAAPEDVHRAALERMLRHAAAGELQVDTDVVPLERAPEAWERQSSAPHTKLVLAVG